MQLILDFLDMGGYAAFVWPALVLTALTMALLAALSLRRLRQHDADLARLEGERPRRRRGTAGGGHDA